MLDDALLAPAAAVEPLSVVAVELDCAAAELGEDTALEERAAEDWALDVLAIGPGASVFAVVAGAASVLCFCVGLEDWPLFGHKLEIMSPLKILPSSVELPTTVPPQLSSTPLAI